MNIVERDQMLKNLPAWYANPLNVLSRVKGGDQTRKMIIGVGSYSYDPASLTSLQNGIQGLLMSVPGVDVVVLLTAFVTILNKQSCTALPSSAWQSTDPRLLTFDQALSVAQAAITRPDVTTAFAFQMGVVSYRLRNAARNVYDAIYKPCMGALLGEMSQACQGTPEELSPEEIMGSVAAIRTASYFVVFDSTQTMMKKGTNVLSSPLLRDKFTWFLLNVHLTDFSGLCPLTPFERVTQFKDFFHQEWTRRRG